VNGVAERTCSINGCDRKHRAKGYCGPHYNQILKPDRHRRERNCEECLILYVTTRSDGRFCSLDCRDVSRRRDTLARHAALPPKAPRRDLRSPLRRALEDGDPAGVIEAIKADTVTTVRGCWEWQRRTNEGYAEVRVAGRTYQVHRLALAARLGASLGKQPAHHTCANARCVNPAHLQPVTHRENAAEMLARTYMVQRIADLEAALAAIAPAHTLLSEVGLPATA
jgi:hypothetical protein